MKIDNKYYDKISNWYLSRNSLKIFLLSFLGIPIYLWMFSITYKLNNYNKKRSNRFNDFIFFLSIFPIIYIFLLIFFIIWLGILKSYSLLPLIIPFHLITMLCTFLLMIFCAKSFSKYKDKTGKTYFDPIGAFFLIWFYIIGIWVVQPKLNELLTKLNPEIEIQKDIVYIQTKPNLIRRIVSCIFDYSLIFGGFYFIVITFGKKGVNGGYTGDYLGLCLIGLWLFFTVIIEYLSQSTIGNKIVRLKVVKKDGGKIQLWQSFLRHLVDLFDMWPFGLLGILTIKYTNNNQRFGDLIANTIVVEK